MEKWAEDLPAGTSWSLLTHQRPGSVCGCFCDLVAAARSGETVTRRKPFPPRRDIGLERSFRSNGSLALLEGSEVSQWLPGISILR